MSTHLRAVESSRQGEPAFRMMTIFEGYAEAYGTYDGQTPQPQPGKKLEIRSTATTQRRPVTVELWRAHIDGRSPLGIIPVREDNTCLWGCIDVDNYDVSVHADLLEAIRKARLPLVVCRSKSGGAHLFLFLSGPAPAADVRAALDAMRRTIGLPETEIYPKQSEVRYERGDLGSWLNMPYFANGDDESTVRGAVKPGGLVMSLGEFLSSAERKRVKPEELARLAAPVAAARTTTSELGNETTAATLADAQARLRFRSEQLAVAASGGRNNLLAAAAFDLARYCRDAGLSESDARAEMLRAWTMSHGGEPGAQREFNDVWSRQFAKGLDHGRPALRGGRSLPVFERIERLEDDDPAEVKYRVQINGRPLELKPAELADQTKFNVQCVAQINEMFRPAPKPIWADHVSAALAQAEVVLPEHRLSVAAQFLEMLTDFLTNRHRGQSREDLLLNRPWEDQDKGRHEFRMIALEQHARAHGGVFATESRKQFAKRIRKLGGDAADITVKGASKNIFWVPSRVIQPVPDNLPLPPLPSDAV